MWWGCFVGLHCYAQVASQSFKKYLYEMRRVWLSEGLKKADLAPQAAQNVVGLFCGFVLWAAASEALRNVGELCSGGDLHTFTHIDTDFWLQTAQVLPGFHLSCHSARFEPVRLAVVDVWGQLSALSSAGTSPSLVNLSSSAVLLPDTALLLASFWAKFLLFFTCWSL